MLGVFAAKYHTTVPMLVSCPLHAALLRRQMLRLLQQFPEVLAVLVVPGSSDSFGFSDSSGFSGVSDNSGFSSSSGFSGFLPFESGQCYPLGSILLLKPKDK